MQIQRLGLEVYDIKNTKMPSLDTFTLYAQIVTGEIRYSASDILEEHIKNLQKKTIPFETIIQHRSKPSKILKPYFSYLILTISRLGLVPLPRCMSPPSSEKEKIIRKNTYWLRRIEDLLAKDFGASTTGAGS